MTASGTSSSNSDSATPAAVDCLLCAETISPYHPASPLHCSCCHEKSGSTSLTCCQECMYRHIVTILDDALTGGQRPLTCPLGCGTSLKDSEIRQVLHVQHQNPIWEWCGWILHWIFIRILWGIFLQPLAPSSIPGSMESSPTYEGWWFYRHTRAERQDILRYERWSIHTALRQQPQPSSSNNNTPDASSSDNPLRTGEEEYTQSTNEAPASSSSSHERSSPRRRNSSRLNRRSISPRSATERGDNQIMMVQTCPAPDCDYRWLVASPSFRREKQQHEQKRVFLWYQPLPPQSQPHPMWVDAEYLHYGRGAPPLPRETTEADKRDARRMVCAKCHYVFCGLCRQPWHVLQYRHASKSCQAYGRLLPASDMGQVAAHAIGARACPQCGLLTQRIDGCNHISCPCGKEYCYVCGASWNPFHYSCVPRPDAGGDCVIL